MSTRVAEQNTQVLEAPQRSVKPALNQEFCLGNWRVLPQLNRIVQRSSLEERQLEPRLIKLLCFLAANDEHVLSREVLVQELWPRVVVNENSLTRAISELRKQLQCQESALINYIETIPKRGYRLLPRVELAENMRSTAAPNRSTNRAKVFTLHSFKYGSTASAACLCLLLAGWLSMNSGAFINPNLDSESGPVLLSDELLDTNQDYLGGELQLSTMTNDSALAGAIAAPVVSLDEKQYAFIQHHTAGSTVFLGALDTAIEPVPVYDSKQYLFNLAWSPVGNNLLFAMKPSPTTTALFSTFNETADLVTLNLNTLEISRLIEDVTPTDSDNSPAGRNLT